MKQFQKTIAWVLMFLSVLVLLVFLSGQGYIFEGIKITYLQGHTTAYIGDFTHFENRKIQAGKAQPWPLHVEYNQVQPTSRLQTTNKELETVAFLVVKNDSIWYERYFGEHSQDARTNSFSMAKSIVTTLLGKAIQQGKISSLQQPVADYFPKFDPRLTVGDLASMASGLNWNESYHNPFSMTAEAYFSDNIRELAMDLHVIEPPGKKFKYLSGNTLLLAMVLEKATGQTLSEYLSVSFWKPMGMTGDALWQLDSQESGLEKAYCCIASNARNFSRFGKLYKDMGNWAGMQLLDTSFVKTAIHPGFKTSPEYGYGFWLDKYKGKEFFYMRGILGQYVIVIPEDDLIITRLGKDRAPKRKEEKHPEDIYVYLEEVYHMLDTPL